VREIDPGEHLAIDTTRPLEENVDALLQQLPAWPHGLTA
jgi:hypothetical protein